MKQTALAVKGQASVHVAALFTVRMAHSTHIGHCHLCLTSSLMQYGFRKKKSQAQSNNYSFEKEKNELIQI